MHDPQNAAPQNPFGPREPGFPGKIMRHGDAKPAINSI
jgi:hypothetical protein